MKTDFKIDYIAKTAAHYTTVGLTPHSQATVEKNNTYFLDVAERAKQVAASQGLQKMRESLPKGIIDIKVWTI